MLQGEGRGVEVVRVELNGKASAACIVDSQVPAAADAQVGTLRDNVYQPFAVHLSQDVSSAVSGMVVYDDDVIPECRLLRQGALYGIAYGLLAVEDGNDDRSLQRKVLLQEVYALVGRGVYQCLDGLQVLGDHLLHLYLHVAVGRVHVVELLDTRCPGVVLNLCVEILVQVEQFALTAQEEAQVVESTIFI